MMTGKVNRSWCRRAVMVEECSAGESCGIGSFGGDGSGVVEEAEEEEVDQ